VYLLDVAQFDLHSRSALHMQDSNTLRSIWQLSLSICLSVFTRLHPFCPIATLPSSSSPWLGGGGADVTCQGRQAWSRRLGGTIPYRWACSEQIVEGVLSAVCSVTRMLPNQ
jgi:hypothetical protein